MDFELSGSPTYTRIAVIGDFADVNDMHDRCSPDSRAARYLAGVPKLTGTMWSHLVDRRWGTTWVSRQHGRVLAVAHLMQSLGPGGEHDPTVLELAVLVRDDVQGQGLGTALARFAYAEARSRRGRAIVASMASTNSRAASILRGLGADSWKAAGLVTHVEISLAPGDGK
ncbi:GNAT family N-acetyltransferase [Streptomyces sp. NBC_01476]|uniref:GNAT family N-acetyltransferase n=1 Tax=Streptomyces sp. NBC_01476 TaxID=2903881 RepID=UPI002E37A8DC|nr:GNAT family N-acetyltransferase [Streptomyces sp. NBC_01476]